MKDFFTILQDYMYFEKNGTLTSKCLMGIGIALAAFNEFLCEFIGEFGSGGLD